MRNIPFDRIRAEIRERLGQNIGALQITPKLLEEITGCRAMGNDTYRAVKTEAMISIPGTMPIWINQDIIAEKAEKLHRKYYYDDPQCHLYRDTLYCECPQKSVT